MLSTHNDVRLAPPPPTHTHTHREATHVAGVEPGGRLVEGVGLDDLRPEQLQNKQSRTHT